MRPFEVHLPAHFAYYIVYPPTMADVPKIRAFADWLVAMAQEDAALEAATTG